MDELFFVGGEVSPMAVTVDPILQASTSRFTLFPIKHDKLWDLYKKAESSFWVAARSISRRTTLTD